MGLSMILNGVQMCFFFVFESLNVLHESHSFCKVRKLSENEEGLVTDVKSPFLYWKQIDFLEKHSQISYLKRLPWRSSLRALDIFHGVQFSEIWECTCIRCKITFSLLETHLFLEECCPVNFLGGDSLRSTVIAARFFQRMIYYIYISRK